MATIKVKRKIGTPEYGTDKLIEGEIGIIGSSFGWGPNSGASTLRNAIFAAAQNSNNLFTQKSTFKSDNQSISFQNSGGTEFYRVEGGRLQTAGTFIFNNVDLVNKAYVDGRTQGLSIKTAVRLGSTVHFPSTYNAIGKTLTATSTGSIATYFDGTNPAAGDRVLVKNQSGNIYNGIYTVTTPGSVGVAAVLTRAADADTTAELLNAYVFVNIGNTLADTSWYCEILSTTNIDTGAIPWTQFSTAGSYIADETTITKVGNTFGLQEMSSATFAGKINDETGYTDGAKLVFSTSPIFTDSIDGISGLTMDVFNSNTTVYAFTGATNLTLGFNDNYTSTTNIITGIIGELQTKTIYIGTGGVHPTSNTTIAIGTSSGGGFSTSINNVLQTNSIVDTAGTFYRQDTTAAPTKTTRLKYSGHLYATKFFGPLEGNAASATTLSSTLAAILGGTGLTSYAAGDILYASATNTLKALNISTNGTVLTLTDGFPAWATPSVSLDDNILDGGSNKYSPYTSRGAGHIYVDGNMATWMIDAERQPTDNAPTDTTNHLAFDGLFYATYFEGTIDGGTWS